MKFICPRCRGELKPHGQDQLWCEEDALTFQRVDGIWRFLSPERKEYYARFIKEYETVRHLEGRFSADAAYYRALPFQDLSGRFRGDWNIRAASFRRLLKILQGKKNRM